MAQFQFLPDAEPEASSFTEDLVVKRLGRAILCIVSGLVLLVLCCNYVKLSERVPVDLEIQSIDPSRVAKANSGQPSSRASALGHLLVLPANWPGGQRIQIEFEGYPPSTFGNVKGEMSRIATKSNYEVVEIIFPEGLNSTTAQLKPGDHIRGFVLIRISVLERLLEPVYHRALLVLWAPTFIFNTSIITHK